MFNYARMMYIGDGVPVNESEAAHYYKLSAKNGNTNAMFIYANMIFKGEGVSADKKEAIKYF